MVTVRVVNSTNTRVNTPSRSSAPSNLLGDAQKKAPMLTRSRAKEIADAHRRSSRPLTGNQTMSDGLRLRGVPTPTPPELVPQGINSSVRRDFRMPIIGTQLVPSAGNPNYPPAWPWTTAAQAGPRFTIHLIKGYVYPLAPSGRSIQVLKIFVDEEMKNRLPVADISFFNNRDGMAQRTVVDYNHNTYLIMGYWDNNCPVNANLIRVCSIPWKGQLVVLGLGRKKRVLQKPAGLVADIEQVLRFFIRNCIVTMVREKRWPRFISLRVDLKTIVM